MQLFKEKRILWILILAYIAVFGLVSSLRQYNFQTQTWDMGIFVQTFWNTVNGRIMQNNIEEVKNHLGVHMSPWLFALVPGYALFPSPYYLLIIQTIALGLGAIPLYLLAKRVLDRKKLALIVAAGYLMYPSLHWINLFDFHPVSFLVPLLLAAFYFAEIKQWLWAWIFLILSASTQEDAILVVMFIGILLLFTKRAYEIKIPGRPAFWTKERKMGMLLAAIMLAYFVVSVKIIMPALGGGLLRLDRYINLGASPPEIIKNVITHPALLFKTVFNSEKLVYLLWLFLPVAFFPVFSWRPLILLAPGLLENLLTSFESQFSGFYQYDSLLVAGIFIGVVYGIKKILTKWPSKENWIKWVLGASMLLGIILRSPIGPVFFPADLFRPTPRSEALRKIVRMVPDNATVAAHTNLIPHLAQREHAYMLGTEPFWVDGKLFKPDVVIIDGADLFGFFNPEGLQNYADSYALSGIYKINIIDDRYFIFVREGVELKP